MGGCTPDMTMTTGTEASNVSTAADASSCGAMMTMPSTPWPMKCSSARCMASESNWLIVATLTKYPMSRAAPPRATSVLVGPYSADSVVTTPMIPERLVTSARAALLRR